MTAIFLRRMLLCKFISVVIVIAMRVLLRRSCENWVSCYDQWHAYIVCVSDKLFILPGHQLWDLSVFANVQISHTDYDIHCSSWGLLACMGATVRVEIIDLRSWRLSLVKCTKWDSYFLLSVITSICLFSGSLKTADILCHCYLTLSTKW
jgi:hypothetical protein